jgi:hypothetical protein
VFDLKDLQQLAVQYRRMDAKKDMAPPAFDKWTLRFTDDPNTLLLIGTDVNGSCQRVEGSADLNQCLLAYMMDGKYRALVVSSETGATLARCMARLLLNKSDVTQPPALLVERCYTANGVHPWVAGLNRALVLFALALGRRLGVPVVVRPDDEQMRRLRGVVTSSPFPAALASLASPCKFEYVDAYSGKMQSPFTIPPGYLSVVSELSGISGGTLKH